MLDTTLGAKGPLRGVSAAGCCDFRWGCCFRTAHGEQYPGPPAIRCRFRRAVRYRSRPSGERTRSRLYPTLSLQPQTSMLGATNSHRRWASGSGLGVGGACRRDDAPKKSATPFLRRKDSASPHALSRRRNGDCKIPNLHRMTDDWPASETSAGLNSNLQGG